MTSILSSEIFGRYAATALGGVLAGGCSNGHAPTARLSPDDEQRASDDLWKCGVAWLKLDAEGNLTRVDPATVYVDYPTWGDA